MALQTLPSFLPWPEVIHTQGFTNQTLDAAGEKYAVIVHAPKAGTLAGSGFRLGSVTTPADLKVSFQSINTSGVPTETVDQFRIIPAASLVPNTWISTGIVSSDGTDAGSLRSVNAQERVAMVIEFADAPGNLNISVNWYLLGRSLGFFRNYAATKFGSWAKVSNWLALGMSLKYSDGTYPFIPMSLPLVADSNYAIRSNHPTMTEVGSRLVVPMKCRVSGLFCSILGSGEFDLVLSDESGQTITTTPVLLAGEQITSAGTPYQQHAMFASPVELDAGQVVHVTCRPTTTTNTSVAYVSVAEPAMLGQLPCGLNYQASRLGTGPFTYDQSSHAKCGLLIDALDDGIGGETPSSGIPMSRLHLGM